MMRQTPLQRRTPLRATKPLHPSTPMRSHRREPRDIGLGQRVAKSNGTALDHRRRPPSVFRSVSHRMVIGAMPCVRCSRIDRSQAAHLNLLALGKGKGLKVSDALLVPLCADDIGERGCHHLLDQSGKLDRATSTALQLDWLQKTRTVLTLRGRWPAGAEVDYQRLVIPYLLRA